MSEALVRITPHGLIQIGDEVYPPQKPVEGRQRVVGLLLADGGVDPARIPALTDAILATVNLNGTKACDCPHVEGSSDPAHQHGYYQCPDCGGLCCTERWTGHAVAGLRWMELMMQQHRHGQVVVRGLNHIQERLLNAVELIARTVPPMSQKRAMRQAVQQELGNLSHIWHQSTIGDSLIQAGEWRGSETTTPRLHEESAERLGEKLAAVTGGISPEAFLERFQVQDPISPQEALRRAAYRPPKPAPAALSEGEPLDRIPTPEPVAEPEPVEARRHA